MPTLQLKVSPLQNPSRYRALAEALTHITAEQWGKRAEVTASYVIVRELPATDWGYGGRTQAARRTTAPAVVLPDS